jgi:hypothetical protein
MARSFVALVLAGAAAISLAQTSERGSIPPGESRDESRPTEGAIEGGSIEQDIDSSRLPAEEIARCQQLTGVLREQCLRDLGGGAGASRPPRPASPPPVQRDPITEPLPQNPREPR